MKRRISAIFLGILMGASLMLAVPAKANEKYASLVMDAETGEILSSRHADSPRYPASLTKMMTLLLVFDALDRGDIKLSDRIYISKTAAAMPPSKLGLRAGSSIRVEDAILILVTKSANDIATATAEYLGKTESRFALLMTRRAQDIGMTRTTFKNASGLPNSGQKTTARDMAKLARYILKRYPHYYKYFSTRNFTYQGKSYRNHNRLMENYSGMDGFKTGYINASGFNLVASAVKNNRRLIGVVFGGRTTATRNSHMADIMNAGFKKAGKENYNRPQIAFNEVANPPPPVRKPGVLVAQSIMQPATMQVASNTITPEQARAMATPAGEDNIVRELGRIRPALQSGAFDELTGQGDFDPSVTKRLETGMLAAAVHKGTYRPQATNVALPPSQPDNLWAVQIGAYTSRLATEEAIRVNISRLPKDLSVARPMIVPLRTANGLLFRARLSGLNRTDAIRACQYIPDCMTIAPKAN